MRGRYICYLHNVGIFDACLCGLTLLIAWFRNCILHGRNTVAAPIRFS